MTTTPLELTIDALGRPEWSYDSADYSTDDASAYWYAYGRLDQGHEPVVIFPIHGSGPSQSATAWHFGRLWAAMQHEYRDPHGPGGAYPSMQGAWDNYVATGGRRIRHH